MSFLAWVTIVLAAVYVVVLAITVGLVTFYLSSAVRMARQLADGLHAVSQSTKPVPQHLTTINGALVSLRDRLSSLDEHLADLLRQTELR